MGDSLSDGVGDAGAGRDAVAEPGPSAEQAGHAGRTDDAGQAEYLERGGQAGQAVAAGKARRDAAAGPGRGAEQAEHGGQAERAGQDEQAEHPGRAGYAGQVGTAQAGEAGQVAEGRDGDGSRPPRVFISYAHESDEHDELVRDLWVHLRARGVDAILDRPAAEQPQTWTAWMGREIPQSDFILVVASPEYRRRAEGEAPKGEGRGVEYEAALIQDLLYEDRRHWLPRILPVLLPGCATADIPRFLPRASGTSYRVDEVSDTALERLVRVLHTAPYETAPPLGPRPELPPRENAVSPPYAGTRNGPASGHHAPARDHRTGLRHEVTVEVGCLDDDDDGGGGGGGGGGGDSSSGGGGDGGVGGDGGGGGGSSSDGGSGRVASGRDGGSSGRGGSSSRGRRRLHTRTLLAGTVLGEHTAVLPTALTRVWRDLPSAPAAADAYLADAGRLLRDTLFDAETAGHLAELAGSSPVGTVLDVVVMPAGDVAARLPFELLRLPEPDSRLLATMAGVHVTRRVGAMDRVATAPQPGPLKILAAVAAPDETRTANPPLDVEAEFQAILDALGDLPRTEDAQVTFLEVASLPQVAAALGGDDSYHVLHLSAHGSPASVELEDEDGNPVDVPAGQLVDALRGAGKPVPLVVLSSCSGAAAGLGGLAAMLVRGGADRVVAMQAAVTDRYATDLARVFYAVLAAEAGASVAGALAQARRVLDLARLDTVRRVPPPCRPGPSTGRRRCSPRPVTRRCAMRRCRPCRCPGRRWRRAVAGCGSYASVT